MMEKRTLIAMGLSLAVLLIWEMVFLGPARKEEEAQRIAQMELAQSSASEAAQQESVQLEGAPSGTTATMDATQKPAEPLAQVEVPADLAQAEAESGTIVETRSYRAQISNRGGVLRSMKLKDYREALEEDVREERLLEMVSVEYRDSEGGSKRGLTPLRFRLEDSELNDRLNSALFQVTSPYLTSKGLDLTELGVNDKRTLKFQYNDGELFAEKEFSFSPEGFLIEIRADVINSGRRVPFDIVWGPGVGNYVSSEDRGRFADQDRMVVSVAPKGKVERPKPAIITEGGRFIAPINWAGIENRYFAAVLIPEERPFEGASAFGAPSNAIPAAGRGKEGDEITTQWEDSFVGLGVRSGPQFLTLFVGPKAYETLTQVEEETGVPVSGILNFGFFSTISRVLLSSLRFFFGWVGDWGLAIVLLTGAIKIVFYPLTHKSFVSMKRMRELQPEMNRIKDKYKKQQKDPKKKMEANQQMNREIMALYKQQGVNPMGGCLPMLLQMPVLWGMYMMLGAAIELRHASFFGIIRDLTAPNIPLVLLMGASMVVQQKMTPTSADPNQARLMMILPVAFTIFFLNMPSGLVLYWFVNNILTIGQQHIINRSSGGKKKPTETGAKSGPGKKKPGKRLAGAK